jgi:hypothetical protein
MTIALTPDILQDDIAIALARVVAVANKRARELGVNVSECVISVIPSSFSGELLWRINYGPSDYVGRRGGDLIIEVDPSDASIKRVLWGQ